MTPQYFRHLDLAGLKDKLEKREIIEFEGDILGVWLSSISMTLSVPQDKVMRLTSMLVDFCKQPLQGVPCCKKPSSLVLAECVCPEPNDEKLL